jgi:hypothetical protein
VKWSAGDSGKCRAAAYDLRGLSAFLAERSADLTRMADWESTGWWTGDAAGAATGSFGKLVRGVDEFSAGAAGLGTTMEEVAAEIDKAVARARTALVVGGVLFVVGTAATIVTIGASEGAAAAAAVAAEGEAGFAFASLGTYLTTAFTTALVQNSTRIAGAILFNLAIPAVGEAVHLGVTGGEWTWGTVAGILIGSSFGIFLGELTMLAQLNLSLPVYQQVLAGSVTIGAAGFAGSAASQAALDGEVDWEVAGYSGASGAVIGAVGAAGAAYVINRFKVTPDQLGVVVRPAAGREIELGPLGAVDQVSVSDIAAGDGADVVIAQDAAGAPILTEEGLAAANLTDAAIADLGASEARLAAAGQVTAHADRLGEWLTDIDGQRAATNAGLDAAVAAAPAVSFAATAARGAGGRLIAAVAEARSVDEEAATEFASAASSPDEFLSAASSEYESASLSSLEDVHEAALEYAGSLRLVQQETAAAVLGPDVTAVAGATPELQAQVEQADQLVAATGSTSSTDTGSYHTAIGAPDIGPLDPAQQLGPDPTAVARSAALKRIGAQSVYGIVIGSGGGATFGGAVLPHVDEPHDGLDVPTPNYGGLADPA